MAKAAVVGGSIVLDASALLALFNEEPGADEVMKAFNQLCLLSAVNHTEVLTKLLDKGLSPADAATVMTSVEVQIVAFDAAQSADAAWLRGVTSTDGARRRSRPAGRERPAGARRHAAAPRGVHWSGHEA